MRMLALDQFSEPGGAQQCLLDLLPALLKAGWSVLAAMPGEGEMFRRVREIGCKTSRIECGPYTAGKKTALDRARFATEIPRLARAVRRLAEGMDLVYINGPRLLPACAAGLGNGRPVIFHSHSYVAPGAARMLAGTALRRMNARVVAACEFVAQPWREYVKSVDVVYNGVADWQSAAGWDPAPQKTIGCVGRIAPEKGQREFLAAAAMIHRALPQCRFVVHGAALFSAVDYEREVRAAAVGLPVEFAGWTTNIYAALAGLDLLLVPSAAHEATTRVIPEAFAAGVPVVAFRSGGIPEVIEDGVNGFLAGSVEEMAQIAIQVLSGESTPIARRAHATWERRFTLERYRQDLISILNSAAARPASTAAPASTGP